MDEIGSAPPPHLRVEAGDVAPHDPRLLDGRYHVLTRVREGVEGAIDALVDLGGLPAGLSGGNPRDTVAISRGDVALGHAAREDVDALAGFGGNGGMTRVGRHETPH